MQLAGKTRMHDIEDVEAFVRATIAKGRLRLTVDQREELVAEGLQIMVRLNAAYDPGRNGLDAEKSMFSGYVAKFLPGKLSDAQHRLQENHRLVTLPTGERRWQYDEKPASLDATLEAAGDTVRELHTEDVYDSDMARNLRSALDRQWEHDREATVKFGVLLGIGYTVGEAVETLRITAKDATSCVERIRSVAHELQVAA